MSTKFDSRKYCIDWKHFLYSNYIHYNKLIFQIFFLRTSSRFLLSLADKVTRVTFCVFHSKNNTIKFKINIVNAACS